MERRYSYSRYERGTVEPRTWEHMATPLRLVVTRRHSLNGWFGVACPIIPDIYGNGFPTAGEAAKDLISKARIYLGRATVSLRGVE